MLAVGARVLGQWSDGAWYPGTISQIGNGTYFIQFDDGDTAWLQPHQIQAQGSQPGKAAAGAGLSSGMRVRSEYEGSWYSGTILQTGPEGYFVQYDDGDSAWKAAHELQPEGGSGGGGGGFGKAAPLAVGTIVKAQWSNGSWYPGKITQDGGGTYFVQFDDGDTAWLPPHQIQVVSPPAGGGGGFGKGMAQGPKPGAAGFGKGMTPGAKGGAPALAPGMRVRSEYEGAFYSGTILQSGPQGFFVQYDDGDSAWKAPHELQPEVGGGGGGFGSGQKSPFAVGMRVEGMWSNGRWYPGTITQDGGGTYFVQFDDGDTAWLPMEKLRLP